MAALAVSGSAADGALHPRDADLARLGVQDVALVDVLETQSAVVPGEVRVAVEAQQPTALGPRQARRMLDQRLGRAAAGEGPAHRELVHIGSLAGGPVWPEQRI